MRPEYIALQTSVRLRGKAIAGAEDRQQKIAGFDQSVFSRSSVVAVGAGGIASQILPTLARKGIGTITILDDDLIEASNLNRQRFYEQDLGKNKALALAANLQGECIAATDIVGHPIHFEQAVDRGLNLSCNLVICGVDNNPARSAVARHFRALRIPVVFTGVSRDGDQGYVFVQERNGACIACLYPDMINDDRYPCPGTPAIADILQAVGALAVYAVDTVLMKRRRHWNYRRISLADGTADGSMQITARPGCAMFGISGHEH